MSSKHDFSVVEGKAQYAFRNIQSRTAHVVSQLQKVVSILLNEMPEELPLQGGAITRARMTLPNLTIEDIEENVTHWAFHRPDNPEVRAALLRLFAENYPLCEKDIPQTLKTLGYADKEVKDAYKAQTGKAISSIFTPKKEKPDAKPTSISPVMEDLIVKLEWQFIRRGEMLFRQGEEGDAVYIIADGLFHIVMEKEGKEIFLAEAGRNELIGELALITNEPRSANVIAVRDSQVCKLSKKDFNALVQKHEVLRSLIIQQIVDRLRKDEAGQRPRYNYPRVITIVPVTPGTGNFGKEFARLLGYRANVIYLNRDRVRDSVPKTMARALDNASHDYEFTAWLEDKEVQNDFVIYETDFEYTGWTERCLQRADRIILVGRADGDPDLTETEARIFSDERENKRLMARQELILLHEPDQQPHNTIKWLTPRNLLRHHHLHISNGRDYARLFRLLFGMGNGLVLSGGGMRGASHSGVYHTIQEMGLKIDAIGGTSAGAIAGALFAMGKDAREALALTKEHLMKRNILLDYTLPVVGLNAARRISQAFEVLFGDIQIEDLPIPFFCVSTNLTTATVNFHTTGSLAKYIRASTSLPGIYPPLVEDDGTLLVDGGVINNLPINEMLDLTTGGNIIAVDVGRPRGVPQNYEYKTAVSGWRVAWSYINPFRQSLIVPSITDTIIRTSMLASQIDAESLYNRADVIIRPDVSVTGMFDVENAEALFDAGYSAANEALDGWREKESNVFGDTLQV